MKTFTKISNSKPAYKIVNFLTFLANLLVRKSQPIFVLFLFVYCLPSAANATHNSRLETQNFGVIASSTKDSVEIANLFSTVNFRNANNLIEGVLQNASFLEIHPKAFSKWTQSDAPLVQIAIPQSSGGEFILELTRISLLTDNFIINTDKGPFDMSIFSNGKFYKGVVQGFSESFVSFSVLEDQVVGMVSVAGVNQVIHKMDNEDLYIMYYTDDLIVNHPFSCGVDDEYVISAEVNEEDNHSKEASAIPCIRVFLECDHALFLNKGSVVQTVNWITAVFNNVAALYEGESVILKLSEVFVWTNLDPYSTTSSVTSLNQFRTIRKSFNGDIAHLAALGGKSLGGVAWLDVLCNSGYRYGYSNIHSTYEDIPVFSWTVEVIAHEIGHNLGSRHTQWCGWKGGPIDNCSTPEGKCTRGPEPEDGGTIMSYCHLSEAGINFIKGLGDQPGDRIRSRVVNATCLSSCSIYPGDVCGKPGEIQLINVSHETALIEWQRGIGALKYKVKYQIKDVKDWKNLLLDTNVVALIGLKSNTWYSISIQSQCDNSFSEPTEILHFKTLSESEYCKSNGLSTQFEWIEHVELANLKRISGSDNGYADASHMIANVEAGKSYILRIKGGMKRISSNEFWRMWIDYNQDGKFDDNELVFGRISNTSNMLTRSIRIPTTAESGLTKMRIAMKNGSHASACEIFEYGEVEDFSILVIHGANLSEEDKNMSLDIFPNPMSDWLNIRNINVNPTESDSKLVIYNLLGNIVWEKQIKNSDNLENTELQIFIADWPAGQYYLVQQMDDSTLQKKFLKL